MPLESLGILVAAHVACEELLSMFFLARIYCLDCMLFSLHCLSIGVIINHNKSL